MEPRDDRPETPPTEPNGVEATLQALSDDLQTLRKDIVVKLLQDITRLQAEKSRLTGEVEKLHAQQQSLAPSTWDAGTGQPTGDGQVWTQELAQLLAAQLQERLSERLDRPSWQRNASYTLDAYPGDRDREIGAIVERSVDNSYRSLDRELSTQQSHLSGQLQRINNLQQQGEAILDALVNRLSEQLQMGAASYVEESPPRTVETPVEEPLRPSLNGDTAPTATPTPQPTAPPKPSPGSQVQKGMVLAFLYASVLSLFNVSVGAIQKADEFTIFGFIKWIGIITPSFGNSLLILCLRMITVMLLMPLVAPSLYPSMWDDLKQFWQNRNNRQLKQHVFWSGISLFASQVLIYLALGVLPVGVAITLFFIFPIVTVLASWKVFGDRPSLLRILVMFVILSGSLATIPGVLGMFSGGGEFSMEGNFFSGALAAIGAGVTFAAYVIFTQLSAKKLHPIPFSFANFSVVFGCSVIGVLVAIFLDVPEGYSMAIPPGNEVALILAGAWLGVLTLVSYVLNNFAIKFAGASLASIVGATGPVLTSLFGWVIIGQVLEANEVFGMVLVTLGVLGLSLERIFMSQRQAAKAAKQR